MSWRAAQPSRRSCRAGVLDDASRRAEERVEQRGAVDRPADRRSRSDVIVAASSAGNSSARPVGVDADARRPRADRAVPSPSVSPRTPPACGPRRRVSTTRSFGHLRRIVPAARPATSSAASAIARLDHRREPPDALGASQVGRKPSDRRSAAPGGAVQVRPSRPRPADLLVGDGEADLRLAVGQPAADDVVRRADDGEPLLAGEERRAVDRAHPAAARFDRLRAARARTPRGARGPRSPGRPRR